MILQIKEHFTIPMIAKEFFPGWEPAESCHSPFREDRNKSFSVWDNGRRWMDFAEPKFRGDVIDFYAACKHITVPEAVRELGERLEGYRPHRFGKWAQTAPKTSAPSGPRPGDRFALPYRPSENEYSRMQADCERLIRNREAIQAMAQAREWQVAVIEDLIFEGVLGLSPEGCITFNFLSGSKSRWLDANGKRQFRWNFGKPWFWRGNLITEADSIWILEGETKLIKALSWDWEAVATRRVIALPAAGFDPAPWAYLFTGKDVAYVVDPDPAGIKAGERVKRALEPVAKSVAILYPEDLH